MTTTNMIRIFDLSFEYCYWIYCHSDIAIYVEIILGKKDIRSLSYGIY